MDQAHFARRHPDLTVRAFLRHELAEAAGRTGQTAALARSDFNVVDEGTDRNERKSDVVARLDVRAVRSQNLFADVEAGRCDDETLLAVHVIDERDPGRAVRIVLDRGDL